MTNNISTNAILNFVDKVRVLDSAKARQLVLTPQEAKAIQFELLKLLAKMAELQDLIESGKISVEIESTKF